MPSLRTALESIGEFANSRHASDIVLRARQLITQDGYDARTAERMAVEEALTDLNTQLGSVYQQAGIDIANARAADSQTQVKEHLENRGGKLTIIRKHVRRFAGGRKLQEFIASHAAGFTVDPENENEPQSGYAVAPSKTTEFYVPREKLTPEVIDAYLEHHRDALENHPGEVYLGGWFNEERGQFCLDMSVVTPDLEHAKQLAKKGDQDAIFDLSNKQQISTRQIGVDVHDEARGTVVRVQGKDYPELSKSEDVERLWREQFDWIRRDQNRQLANELMIQAANESVVVKSHERVTKKGDVIQVDSYVRNIEMDVAAKERAAKWAKWKLERAQEFKAAGPETRAMMQEVNRRMHNRGDQTRERHVAVREVKMNLAKEALDQAKQKLHVAKVQAFLKQEAAKNAPPVVAPAPDKNLAQRIADKQREHVAQLNAQRAAAQGAVAAAGGGGQPPQPPKPPAPPAVGEGPKKGKEAWDKWHADRAASLAAKPPEEQEKLKQWAKDRQKRWKENKLRREKGLPELPEPKKPVIGQPYERWNPDRDGNQNAQGGGGNADGGVHANKLLPQGEDQKQNEIMEAARVGKVKHYALGGGCCGSFRTEIEWEKNGVKQVKQVVFKPVSGEYRRLRDDINDVVTPYAYRELMAYNVARDLGIEGAPAVALVTLDKPQVVEKGDYERWKGTVEQQARKEGKRFGSAMEFVPNARVREELPTTTDKQKERVNELAMFDYLIGNSDRHYKNYMVGRHPVYGEGWVTPIDNGTSFPDMHLTTEVSGHNQDTVLGARKNKSTKGMAKVRAMLERAASPEFKNKFNAQARAAKFSEIGIKNFHDRVNFMREKLAIHDTDTKQGVHDFWQVVLQKYPRMRGY